MISPVNNLSHNFLHFHKWTPPHSLYTTSHSRIKKVVYRFLLNYNIYIYFKLLICSSNITRSGCLPTIILWILHLLSCMCLHFFKLFYVVKLLYIWVNVTSHLFSTDFQIITKIMLNRRQLYQKMPVFQSPPSNTAIYYINCI